MAQSLRSFSRRVPLLLAAALLLALLAVNAYRAATQAIAHDEALSYQWFLSGPWSDLWTDYNANHHVFYNLLARLSLALCGPSEWAQRLPSVGAGALYFYFCARLCGRLFGRGWFFLLAVTLLTLNPFLLDYLSAARGYGLALALLMGALWQWNGFPLDPGLPRRLLWVGVFLGLAMAANLTMLFPAAALLAVIGGWLWQAQGRPGLQLAFIRAALPAGAVAGAFLLVPMSHLEAGAFYAGAGSLRAGLESVIRLSAFHAAGPVGLSRWCSESSLVAAALGLVMLVYLGALIRAGQLYRAAAPSLPARALITLAALLAFILAEVIAARALAGMPYPELRTGLYFIPLWTLTALLLAIHLSRPARVALSLLSLAAVAQYGAAFETRYYAEWRYAAATRRTMELIRDRGPRPDGRPVRVGATWLLEPCLNYYRDRLGLPWVAPILRVPFDREFDYYALWGDDKSLVAQRHLHPIFDDPVSEQVLAVPPRR